MTRQLVYEAADHNCRTIAGDLEHRIYVKFMRLTTGQLVRKLEAASDDTNLDDESFELSSRLNAIGYDWAWEDFAGMPAPHRIVPLKAD